MNRSMATVVVTVVVATSAASQEGGTTRLRAGAHKVDFTPKESDLQIPTDSIRDRLFARAIVVDDGRTCAVLVGIDLGAAGNQIVDEAIPRASKATGCPAQNFVISATHTHSSNTEGLGQGAPTATTVAEAIVDAATVAKSKLAPARVGYGKTAVDLNVNRDLFNRKLEWRQEANPDGPSDKTLAVVEFLGEDNVPIGVYMNYAMHPINFYLSGVISADFPGEASRYVEDLFDDRSVGVFSQGASGDQNPRDFRSPTLIMAQRTALTSGRGPFMQRVGTTPAPEDASPRGFNPQRVSSERTAIPDANLDAYRKVLARTGDHVRMLGSLLGSSAVRVMRESIEPVEHARIWAGQQIVSCPGRERLDADNPARENVFPGYKDGPDVNLKVGLLRLGDIHFVTVNGEVYSEIAMRLKAEAPASHTIMVTLANGSANAGYIYADRAYSHLTFQVIGSRLKPGCAEGRIVAAALALMRQPVSDVGDSGRTLAGMPMRTLAARAVIFGLIVCGGGLARAQIQAPQVFAGAPAAFWIFPPGSAGNEFGVFHFRRVFELDAKPSNFVVHVSADNRYRLFINGEQVSSGPQRSDLMHWRYETVDLAPHLRVGRNVLAAIVWNWGAEKPVAQFSRQTAFLLQGNSPREAVVNSGPEWKVLRNEGYAPIPVQGNAIGGYYASPPGETIDARRYPWGWTQLEFSEKGWVAAAAGEGPRARRTQLRASNPFGEAGGWQLVARSIPPMEESPIRFATVRRSEGIAPDDSFLRGTGNAVVPPKTRAVLLLDQAHLTNAFTVLETSGGAGSTVALVYAEALKDKQGNKGNRNEIDGKTIAGVRDEFRPDGGERRRFQTLWFRTYRYVQLEIETGDETLRIHDLHGIFVGYPFEVVARFESDLGWLADMWEINWRGARLCAWETYFDTPYYEQLQYVGDTRIQALITLFMTGDDRLVRQAIEHFDLSRIADGITASRYPSDLGQYIPTFSPIWVAMVHDFWMHRDDPEYVRGTLPGIRAVLGWFERRVDDTGMVGPISWWPFVDWAKEWARGVPPGGAEGRSTVISLQFVYALDRAAELEDAVGIPALADHYRRLAGKVRDAVRKGSWDAARGLFRDTPKADTYSQQANVMAVLTDAVAPADQAALMERVLSDATLTQSTYYFSYYQLEALLKAGLGERYVDQLAPWRGMLDLGLTTVPETPEPTRSDSHAWSAHPNYGLLATVLGVRPGAPGFKRVRIAPHLGPLQRAEGRVPHPLGEIVVRLARTEGGGVRGEVTLPEGLTGVLVWGGKETALRSGRQELSF